MQRSEISTNRKHSWLSFQGSFSLSFPIFPDCVPLLFHLLFPHRRPQGAAWPSLGFPRCLRLSPLTLGKRGPQMSFAFLLKQPSSVFLSCVCRGVPQGPWLAPAFLQPHSSPEFREAAGQIASLSVAVAEPWLSVYEVETVKVLSWASVQMKEREVGGRAWQSVGAERMSFPFSLFPVPSPASSLQGPAASLWSELLSLFAEERNFCLEKPPQAAPASCAAFSARFRCSPCGAGGGGNIWMHH